LFYQKEERIEIIKFIIDFNLLKYRNAIVHWDWESLNSFIINYLDQLYVLLDILIQAFQEEVKINTEKFI